MLLTISAQPADLPPPGGEAPPGAAFGPATAGELVTFAEILRRPIPVRGPWPPAAAAAEAMPALPAGGKLLPPGTRAAALAHDSLPEPEASIGEEGVPADRPVESISADDAQVTILASGMDQRMEVSVGGQASTMHVVDAPYRSTFGTAGQAVTARAPEADAPLSARVQPAPPQRVSLGIESIARETVSPDAAELTETTAFRAAPDAGGMPQAGTRTGSVLEAMIAALGRDAGAAVAADRPDHVPVSLPAPAVNATTAPGPGAAPAAPQPPVPAGIAVPMGEPGWADAFGDQVLVLAGKQVQRAEIRLNPAELGPVQVRITVEEDGTTLAFSAQHAVTRDAIEQALPRLRELFSDQGLSLLDTSVSEHGGRQEQEARLARGEPQFPPDGVIEDDGEAAPSGRPVAAARHTLIDTFA